MSLKNTNKISVFEENATHGEVTFRCIPHKGVFLSFEKDVGMHIEKNEKNLEF